MKAARERIAGLLFEIVRVFWFLDRKYLRLANQGQKSGTGAQHMRSVALKAARNIGFLTILIPSEGGSIPKATLEMHQGC